MLKKSKWVKSQEAKQPISKVVCRVVDERLNLIWHYVPLAAQQWQQDVEYVHQLRVATRRAGAALDVFDPLLPSKRTRMMKKHLRRIRRAAGAARDLDVLSQRLHKEVDEGGRVALATTFATLDELRLAAQKPIVKVGKRLAKRGFPDAICELTERIRWRKDSPEPTYQRAARNMLRGAVDGFYAAAQEDLTDVEKLHELRIAGKSLRYTMELLSGAFAQWFREELYPEVEAIQEKLGGLNDHVTARQNFQEWSERTSDPAAAEQFRALAAAELEQLEREKADFLQWWTAERSEQLKESFAQLLPPGN